METPYVAVDCKLVHLGPSNHYSYLFNRYTRSTVIPTPDDFGPAPKLIVGWKCCCPSGQDDNSSCVLARGEGYSKEHSSVALCKYPKTWNETSPSMKIEDFT